MSSVLETWQLPHNHIGRRVLRFGQLSSTNDYAAGLAQDATNHGVVVLADEQMAGRGQYGRVWHARAGSSVLMSIVLFLPPDLRGPALLTAWATVAACETIQQATGWQPTIKWPNDVLLLGQKVCGILIEQSRAVVVGIGLNVDQTVAEFEAAALPLAGSLTSITGRVFAAPELARSLIERLDRGYDLLHRGVWTALESSWRARLGLLDQKVVAEEFSGAQHLGTLRDLTFDVLRLECADGTMVQLLPESVRLLAEDSA